MISTELPILLIASYWPVRIFYPENAGYSVKIVGNGKIENKQTNHFFTYQKVNGFTNMNCHLH